MTKYRNVLTQTDFGPMIININDNTIGMCISKYGYWGAGDIQLIQGILTTLYPRRSVTGFRRLITNARRAASADFSFSIDIIVRSL
jgi:hypothetical protein